MFSRMFVFIITYIIRYEPYKIYAICRYINTMCTKFIRLFDRTKIHNSIVYCWPGATEKI